MASSGLIGGNFSVTPNPAFCTTRDAVFERLWARQQAAVAALPDQPISVTLPNGDVKSGFAYKTTPYDVAKSISQGLADNVIVAKVEYSNRLEIDAIVACDEDEESKESAAAVVGSAGELWDLNRPLVGDCKITLLKFEEPEAKTVSVLFFRPST
jgi:threonyl-tRNA synthetase